MTPFQLKCFISVESHLSFTKAAEDCHAFVGSGIRRDAPLSENERRLIKEITELRKANEILKDALVFFAKDRKR